MSLLKAHQRLYRRNICRILMIGELPFWWKLLRCYMAWEPELIRINQSSLAAAMTTAPVTDGKLNHSISISSFFIPILKLSDAVICLNLAFSWARCRSFQPTQQAGCLTLLASSVIQIQKAQECTAVSFIGLILNILWGKGPSSGYLILYLTHLFKY